MFTAHSSTSVKAKKTNKQITKKDKMNEKKNLKSFFTVAAMGFVNSLSQ